MRTNNDGLYTVVSLQPSEYDLRVVAPGFVGNARGGRTAAILASLTSTCRRHDVDPQLYLTQLLINLPATRIKELSIWLPDQWKQLHAARMASLQSPAPPAA